MLKKFFLNTLSSFVGAWIALVLFGVVGVIVAVGLVAGMHGTDEVASVKKTLDSYSRTLWFDS